MKSSKPMPTLIATTCEAVKQSLETFAENNPSCNLDELSGAMVSTLSQALHDALMEGGRAGLKQFIQRHESSEENLQREGKSYRFKTTSEKAFLTIFGEIRLERRLYYHWAAGPAVVPLDEAWQMDGRFATPEVTEALLLSAAMLVPGDVEELFAKMSPFKPSASLVQDLLNQDGAALGHLLENPELARQARPVELPKDQPLNALAVSLDGANVLVREPGAKRGRPRKKPGKDAQRQQGDSSYKNAMVGSISFYKQSDQVIDFETGAKTNVAERIDSIYHARMPQARAPKFKEELERSLTEIERSLPKDTRKVLLMDGARGLWSYVEQTPLYDSYIKAVDFFHSAEHLSLLGEALFGKDNSEATQWYEKWLHKIKHESGGVDAMLRSARRYEKANRLSKARLKQVNTQRTFFKRNKHRMRYAELLAESLPIGSGPVEAACKTIVKARFCQSGMRWSLKGGQNVMNLRAVQKSGQWDTAWQTYRKTGGYQRHRHPEPERAAA